MEGLREFTRMVEKTRIFLFNLIGAVSFFVYGGFFTGYWLIIVSLPLTDYMWVLGLVGAVILGIGLSFFSSTLPWPKIKAIKELRRSSLRWLVSFVLPFIIAYNIMPLIIDVSPEVMEKLVYILWYPSLGVALILAHTLVMRPLGKLNPGLIKSKPFLVAGVIILATTPMVFIVLWLIGTSNAWTLALGLMIIAYTTSGVYSLSSALRVFEE